MFQESLEHPHLRHCHSLATLCNSSLYFTWKNTRQRNKSRVTQLNNEPTFMSLLGTWTLLFFAKDHALDPLLNSDLHLLQSPTHTVNLEAWDTSG